MTPASEARIIELLEQLVAATQQPSALMDAAAVARELDIGVRTLQRLRQLGQVPKPIKVGSALRWRRSDIDQFTRGQVS